MVRATYEERIVVSTKQKAALDKWEKKDPAKQVVEHVTTEEEESDFYNDSNYSD